MRVGKQEVLQVLRVDEEKGYVDLSKKLLTPKDIENCSERYEKGKVCVCVCVAAPRCFCRAMFTLRAFQIVNGILRRLAETTNVSLPALYDQFGFALYEGEDGHPYDMLQASLLNPALLAKVGAKGKA